MRRLFKMAGLLVATLLIWQGLGIPVFAAEESFLSATGQGTVLVETAIAVIRLGVLVRGTAAQTVQEQVAERSNQLITQLKALQVEKLQTTGISLNLEYDYSGGKPRTIGVQGQNNVQFQVPIPRAGQVLDQAIAAGATQVDSVTFRATDAVLATAKQQALDLAVKDAQNQSQQVLKSLGLSIKSIRRIAIQGSGSVPIPMPEASFARTAALSTPVLGSEQSVSASVLMEFNY